MRNMIPLLKICINPKKKFYDGIPEYEMLKRDMTEEERIRNGYWVAYQVAERVEKKRKA